MGDLIIRKLRLFHSAISRLCKFKDFHSVSTIYVHHVYLYCSTYSIKISVWWIAFSGLTGPCGVTWDYGDTTSKRFVCN